MKRVAIIISAVFMFALVTSCTQRTCPTYTDSKVIKEMPQATTTTAKEDKKI